MAGTDSLVAELRERVDGEVRFDAGSRGAYSTDASNFRQVPIGVVVPRTVEAGAAAVEVCRDHGVPLLSRGGGTSLAGQCTNTAVVIDWSKYCRSLLEVDTGSRTCVVETGIVLDHLNDQLADTGLRFGPEPATHLNCTIGGMIGNNSCGATAQRTGKVVDNVRRLEVMLPDGTRFWCGRTDDGEYARIERRGDRRAGVYRSLRRIREEYADEIRRRFPDIPRRVSGYNLDSLLPEQGFDVARLLVGSESTLVTVLRAELDLVPVVPHRALVVLGFEDITTAADAVPSVLEHDPLALEGVDRFLVHDERLKHMNAAALDELPDGVGFLMVQLGGDTQEEANERANGLAAAMSEAPGRPSSEVLTDPETEDELWQVREAGLGATAHVPAHRDTWEGWEDSAVPVERLGAYLRDLRGLYREFGYESDVGPSLYGHFGQGCVHTRIPFDLYTRDGVATYRRFMERAADLVASYGGSFSGEHGDGQSRGELLPRMFGDRIVSAFEELKAVFDPEDRMNPGKVVHPAPLDAHLRLGGGWAPRDEERPFFGFPHDGGSFADAANRCVGVGRCRQTSHEDGEVMCPSYQVTREEIHSTRGRSRLLFEMLDGHGDGPIGDGWRSEDVRQALDLCLACKGCRSDCPAEVDMATYKAEFLAHHYRGRIRPRADLATGWLPLLALVVERAGLAGAVNRVGRSRLSPLLMRAAGLEPRPAPVFAEQTLQQWAAGHRSPDGLHGRVLLWPDTFTTHFDPQIGRAAVDVLERAGWQVEVPTEPLCCGLTWISTGQLKTGRRVLGRTVRKLAAHVRSGGPVVGLEPSCTAVFRNDAPELLPRDRDAARLSHATRTLAELLTGDTPGWQPPRREVSAIAQVHCHQHAVIDDWAADRKLLEAAGADVERLEAGCCGLAGNFGFTGGHGEISEAIAEQALLPKVRAADPGTLVLADGFSCRTQIRDLHPEGREPIHLAQLLADDDVGQDRSSAAPSTAKPTSSQLT